MTLGLLAILAGPALASAHPLGNFTINHYAGIRVEPERILLDVVIDQAEIPTFQARADLDDDGDGDLSDAEIEAGRVEACQAQVEDLTVTADGVSLGLRLSEAGLSFAPGVGGLATMRLVCGLDAALPASLVAGTATRLTFRDDSFAERLGWREIVVTGSAVTVSPADGELRSESVSARLTDYPEELLAQPLSDTAETFDATLGGADLPPFEIPDAQPIDVDPTDGVGSSASPEPEPSFSPSTSPIPGAVPGGIGGEGLPDIFATADLTPLVVFLSLLTAAALGAGHALTPGHGKTLMAAYLVGMRGTPLHALGLGLAVSVSHTVGILVLAAVVVGAADILPADVVVRTAPLVAAVSIVVIGAWMVVSEVRRRRRTRAHEGRVDGAHDHATEPDHDHDHAEHDHATGHDHAEHDHAEHDDAHATEHGHATGHDDDHDHAEHDDAHATEHSHDHAEHSHGGLRHSHLPAAGTSVTWRSLFVLGLAGGLIPSTSALLILLGSIAAGRPAFGFVLVVAFGLGMAAVMTGIGLVIVVARGRLDGFGSGTPIGRLAANLPLLAAVLVFGLGLYLTVQAVAGAPAL